MEKLLIGNKELSLIPMGINLNTQNKTTRFDIVTMLSYMELENILLIEDNLKVIKHLSDSDETLATYTDCVGLKSITKECGKYITGDSVAHDVFTIVLNTDATVTKIRVLEKEIQVLRLENDTLKEEKLLSELDTDYRLSILELGL